MPDRRESTVLQDHCSRIGNPVALLRGNVGLQVCDEGGRSALNAPAVAVARKEDSLHLDHEMVPRVADVHGGHFGPAAALVPFAT